MDSKEELSRNMVDTPDPSDDEEESSSSSSSSVQYKPLSIAEGIHAQAMRILGQQLGEAIVSQFYLPLTLDTSKQIEQRYKQGDGYEMLIVALAGKYAKQIRQQLAAQEGKAAATVAALTSRFNQLKSKANQRPTILTRTNTQLYKWKPNKNEDSFKNYPNQVLQEGIAEEMRLAREQGQSMPPFMRSKTMPFGWSL